jgi:alkaline phosphatase D
MSKTSSKPPSVSRRAVLRTLAWTSATLTTAACADDAEGTSSLLPDTSPDATPDAADAGVDAASDAGADAQIDAQFDAELDVAPDTDTWSEGDDGTPPDVEPPPEYEYTGEPGPETLFAHGVASGDPLADAVILWTRVSPEGDAAVEVFWEMAYDPEFTRRVRSGTLTTDSARDYTVKVDADGLWPATTYYYRFRALGRASIVGRTRTAPRLSGRHLRFAVVSCSNYPNGYFHVYRALAERTDLDGVFHLGDYIYEYGGGSGDRRHDPPREIVTIEDYRTRYGQYRRDPDLQAVHQQHPFFVVWDDHESTNNSWRDGAENHQASEGDWAARRAAAEQAYSEWMPIRDSADGNIWRSFSFGPLCDIVLLDTRLWGRDEQTTPADLDGIRDPERSLLGDDQEAWFHDTLRTSTARWKLVGQQVMMGQLLLGDTVLNTDQWDGYEASRTRFLDVLENEDVDNVVVLTGDIHTSWANDISRDPRPGVGTYDAETGEGSLAVEFVTPSVTSGALDAVTPEIFAILAESNPHIRWAELTRKGFVVVDVQPERVQGAWHFVSDITQRDFSEEFAKAFHAGNGANHLVEDDAPAPAKETAPASAPGLVPRD